MQGFSKLLFTRRCMHKVMSQSLLTNEVRQQSCAYYIKLCKTDAETGGLTLCMMKSV